MKSPPAKMAIANPAGITSIQLIVVIENHAESLEVVFDVDFSDVSRPKNHPKNQLSGQKGGRR